MSEQNIETAAKRPRTSRRDFLKLSALGFVSAMGIPLRMWSSETKSPVEDTPENLIHKAPIESLEELNELTREIVFHQRAHFKIVTPEALQPLIDKSLIKWEDIKFNDPSDSPVGLLDNVAHSNGQLRILMDSIAQRRNWTEAVAVLITPFLTWRVDEPAFMVSDVGRWYPHFEEGVMNIDGSILLQPGISRDYEANSRKGIISYPTTRSWAVITATTNWQKQKENNTGFDEELIKPKILRIGPWGRNILNYYEPAYMQVGTLTPRTEFRPRR